MELIMLVFILFVLINTAKTQQNLARNAQLLDVEDFDFTTVPRHLLKDYPNVTQLSLSGNKLRHIEKNDFRLQTKLKTLDLSNNNIYGIHEDAFLRMLDLEIIDLRNNNLKFIPRIKAPNLKMIHFGNNDISRLSYDDLMDYKSVEQMIFQRNRIVELKSKTFDGKPNLKHLDLSGNPLETIQPLSLKGATNLHTLLLNKTEIESIPQHGVENIENLDISNNPHLLHIPDEKFFKAIRNIKVTYSMHCCVFQNPSNHIGHDHGGEDIICTPSPNSFNPCEDMLGPLRAIAWILCLVVVCSNLFLLIVMFKSEQNTVHRLLMYNFGFANLLMGIYLFALCCIDAYSYGEYYQVAQQWQYSGGCKTIGFIAIFSLSLSLSSVILITVERFVLIRYSLVSDDFKIRRGAKICIAASWIYSFILALLPAVNVNSYTHTALCLPLDITTPEAVGYITWILLSYLFALTAICYMHYNIFNTLKATSTNDGQGINENTTKRLAIVIFSNFVWWLPISIAGLIVIFANHSFDKKAGKILIFLSIPLSAAISPIIYALLTKRFQEDVRKMFYSDNQNNMMNEEDEYRGRASSYFKHIFHGKQRSETKTSVLMHCHEGDTQQSNCTIINEKNNDMKTNKNNPISATVDPYSHKSHIQQLSGSPNIYRDERSNSTRGLLEDYRKKDKTEEVPVML